ncbi:ABC transporter substrate-binding protein [Clostridium prolinivorans]|jgi:putative aldouronate transport system substrate-binding protein|uniref:ABC transporter substrate-binding protein n=1 Tax=Clostridium prolinivorans TaxID=2769420 RepID=UPI000FD8A310|nr:extracellular solute-binding protein [Clostridium prolinivorans]
MNKKLKTLVMTTLVFSLTASLLVGCSKKTETTNTNNISETKTDITQEAGKPFKAKEAFSVSMLFNDMPNYPYKDTWTIFKEIESRTNVKLDLTVVPYSDYTQKRSLLISTGDAPIIIPKTYPGEEVQFIPSGAILPVSDYIEYMPNMQKKIKDWNMEEDMKQVMQADGKYYILPGLHEKPKYDYSLLIRKDIFDQNGIKIPTSWDEVYDALKALKAKYPDSYPFSDRWKTDAITNVAAPTFGVSAGWGAGNGLQYDENADKFYFGPISDEYKNFVTYWNKLVKEGLMDPESFTQSDDQAKQKFITGKSFVISSNTQETLDIQKTMEKNLGKDKFVLLHMPTPAGPKGDVVFASRLENGIMISSKAKDNPHFEDIMRFVDWLWYSDEGQELTKWGVEGTTFKKDSNGKRTLMPDITFNGMNPNGTKDLRKDFGYGSGVFVYGGSQDLKMSMMNDLEISLQNSMANKKMLPPAPPILFNEDQREQFNMKDTPLMDYVKAQTLKFMLGSEPLSNWDNFVSQCKAKGADSLVELANQVYDNTKDKLK